MLVKVGCGNNGNIISLSYLLDSKVRMRFVKDEDTTQFPDTFTDVFLMGECSEKLRSRMETENKYKLKRVSYYLWQVKKLQ